MPSYNFADEVYEIELANGRTPHICNPRCDGDIHFDVGYEFREHATEEQVKAIFNRVNILTCKRILEYPIVVSSEGDVAIGAYAITYMLR